MAVGRRALLVTLVVAGATAAPARTDAGVITAAATFSLPGFSTGSLSPGLAAAPNNDNTAAPSPNVVGFQIFFNTFGLAEFEFSVAPSGGTTEYRFSAPPPVGLPVGLVNNTGRPWSAFEFQLGFGTAAAFAPSPAADSLDFDTPDRDPAPASSVFPILVHDPDLLRWSGAVVPSVGGVAFSFQVDVPDGIDRFTVRLRPVATVPEPGTLVLVGAGVAAALVPRRRRR